jgi:MFS family permease
VAHYVCDLLRRQRVVQTDRNAARKQDSEISDDVLGSIAGEDDAAPTPSEAEGLQPVSDPTHQIAIFAPRQRPPAVVGAPVEDRRIATLAYGILKLGDQCFARDRFFDASPRLPEDVYSLRGHNRQDTTRVTASVEAAKRRSHSGPGELLAVLRLNAFREYTVSRSATGVATSLLQALILWQVYAISGSPLSLGIVGLVAFVSAFVSSLISGVIVDSYDRRTILFAAQLVPGVGSLVMLVAIASGWVSLEMVYVLVFVTGVASAFEFPARQAILPDVVPRSLFTRALTLNAASSSLTSVTGPALGGLLIATGGVGAAYLGHIVLVAVAMLSLIPLRLKRHTGGGRLELAALRQGMAFVRDRPLLLGAMTLDMFAVLFGGARALLPVYAVDVLHASAVGYGILSASLEAGTLLMALLLIMLPIPRRPGRLLLIAVAAFGLATILFGVSTALPLSIAAYVMVGMADQVSMVMRHTMIQLNTPDALRGRVTGLSSIFISASNELGALESGLVAAATGAVFAVVSGGFACLIVVALIAWRIPTLRRYDRTQNSELRTQNSEIS